MQRSAIAPIAVMLILTLSCLVACQSQAELEQQIRDEAQRRAEEELARARDAALRDLQTWWESLWNGLTLPSLPVIGNPIASPTPYRVGSSNARGRECPRLNCAIAVTYSAGQEIQVLGSRAGDVVQGSDAWLVVAHSPEPVYVHSSLAAPLPSGPAQPQPPNPGTNIPEAVPPLAVPFLTQIGSAGVAGKGSNNCGPASVAMVINYFGGTISVGDAALAIRGSNRPGNSGTNFKGASTASLLVRATYNLTTTNVTTYDAMRHELSLGHPVIILVNNTIYRTNNPAPYINNNDGWFVNNHIVVVTGYDADYVYINDPLRYTTAEVDLPKLAGYKIPVALFQSAASQTPESTPSVWFAMSVRRNG